MSEMTNYHIHSTYITKILIVFGNPWLISSDLRRNPCLAYDSSTISCTYCWGKWKMSIVTRLNDCSVSGRWTISIRFIHVITLVAPTITSESNKWIHMSSLLLIGLRSLCFPTTFLIDRASGLDWRVSA